MMTFDEQVMEGGENPHRYLYVAYEIDERCRGRILQNIVGTEGLVSIRFAQSGIKDDVFEVIVYSNSIPFTGMLYDRCPNTVKGILDVRDVTSLCGDDAQLIHENTFWHNINKAYADRGIDLFTKNEKGADRMERNVLMEEIDLYEHLKWLMERDVKHIYKSELMNRLDAPMSTRIEGWAEGIRYAINIVDYQIEWRKRKLLEEDING